MTKSTVYWLCQILGWGAYGAIQVFLYTIVEGFDFEQLEGVVYQTIYYVLTTHLFRTIIIDWGWLNLSLWRLIPRILIATLFFSFLNYGYLIAIEYFKNGINKADYLMLTILINILGYWGLYFLWTIFYFAFHYVERYNNSLKEKAASREVELNNLKSQLNPHFIFNALNSIRALIDENPRKSKEAITQLSYLIRSSLNSDRKKLIPFEEELKTVLDYLALESIRYEERLKKKFEIHKESANFLIPPLMIQTLIENGIKHGISELTEGGEISLTTQIKNENLYVEIRNTGQLKSKGIPVGIGLENTMKRLSLIYGDSAKFEIFNENSHTVLTRVSIPKYQ